ncbi:MAG: TIM barrel protein [Candidatus Dormibacteraeota bacterium]|nr:TIM barrel protein [Candidatus Dormibacteraeota bacterium]
MSEGATGSIVIANAPVSYGAFELTVGIDPNVPDASMVLDEVAAAGYSGIDLGPVGYLGDRGNLARELASRGLTLSGGFFELPFSDPVAMPAALRGLDDLLDVFDAAPPPAGGLKAKPTLADAGSDLRRARPCQSARDHSLGLDAEGWKRFAEGVEMAVARCVQRGYEATLHHETGTYVEAPWEISAALEHTRIGLCLDTGHLLLGGGDPMRALTDWGSRINHVHLKDARQKVVDGIVREAAAVAEIWRRRAFCRLGEGDLQVDAVLENLRGSYTGWLVVEQDVLPDPDRESGRPAVDQRANRDFLAARGF